MVVNDAEMLHKQEQFNQQIMLNKLAQEERMRGNRNSFQDAVSSGRRKVKTNSLKRAYSGVVASENINLL